MKRIHFFINRTHLKPVILAGIGLALLACGPHDHNDHDHDHPHDHDHGHDHDHDHRHPHDHDHPHEPEVQSESESDGHDHPHPHEPAEHAEAAAHGDHDHAHEVVVTHYTDRSELFMEHEELVAETPVRLVIHLTRTSDFTPITSGSLVVRVISERGETYSVREDAPARPGIFLPVIEVPFPGQTRMEIEVASPRLDDIHRLEGVAVYASASDVPHAPHADDDPDEITFLKEQQWQIDFANEPAAVRRVRQAMPAAVTFRYPSDGQSILPAPSAGIVRLASPDKPIEAGDAVIEGQPLFAIVPDSEWQTGPARLREDYLLARSELERVRRLQEEEAVSDRRVEEARVRFETLQTAVERLGWDGLMDDASLLSAEVKAPISGFVGEVFVVSGQRVAAGDPLARVVNPDRLILEARTPASRLSADKTIVDVVFQPAGDPRRYRLSDLGEPPVPSTPLVGSDDNLATVRFRLDNPDHRFLAGTRGTAFLLADDASEEGVAIPVSAIHEENGFPVVFVQTGGESFEKRTLRLGTSDGAFTRVLSGIEVGERVVTEGAAFIRLASLATTEMGHGHVH